MPESTSLPSMNPPNIRSTKAISLRIISAQRGLKMLCISMMPCFLNRFRPASRYTATIRPMRIFFRNSSTFHTLVPTPLTMLVT